jgi:hypothetical protein
LHIFIRDALQQRSILSGRALGILPGGYILAQVIERGQNAPLIQFSDGGNTFVECLASYETPSGATSGFEVSYKTTHRIALRQCNKETA